MAGDASELARRLSCEAEAVCRHYLSNGRRAGRYWLVGDVYNTPGRSMFVRLQDSPKGPAGKFTDAATGQHGDFRQLGGFTRTGFTGDNHHLMLNNRLGQFSGILTDRQI